MEVLRISRLTGKTGLFNKQDMGPIPVVLNLNKRKALSCKKLRAFLIIKLNGNDIGEW